MTGMETMQIRVDNASQSAANVNESKKPGSNASVQLLQDSPNAFQAALAEATPQSASTEQPSAAPTQKASAAAPAQTAAITSVAAPQPVKYALAKGPGYGSGVGTAGYGDDHAPSEIMNTLHGQSSEAEAKTAIGKGPGYGSAVGTAGYGDDHAPAEIMNSLHSQSSEAVAKTAIGKGPGYGSGVGTAGSGDDHAPSEIAGSPISETPVPPVTPAKSALQTGPASVKGPASSAVVTPAKSALQAGPARLTSPAGAATVTPKAKISSAAATVAPETTTFAAEISKDAEQNALLQSLGQAFPSAQLPTGPEETDKQVLRRGKL